MLALGILEDYGSLVTQLEEVAGVSVRRGKESPSGYLSDISPIDKPWDIHRKATEDLIEIFLSGDYNHIKKAERMFHCSRVLEFGTDINEGGRLKLKSASFCRVRTCPTCQWRRRVMWLTRFYKAFPKIYEDHPTLKYLMLTLTVKNCSITELKKEVKKMSRAWDAFSQFKVYPAVGSLRTLEVTRGKDGTAHPHYHSLLAVEPSYFSRNYLSQKKWSSMWQESLKVDYSPICDIHLVRGRSKANELTSNVVSAMSSAVMEVVKYSTSEKDMIDDPDWILEMSDQISNSRAIALGGIFRKYLKEDKEEGNQDLITDDGEIVSNNEGGEFFYWRGDPSIPRYKKVCNKVPLN